MPLINFIEVRGVLSVLEQKGIRTQSLDLAVFGNTRIGNIKPAGRPHPNTAHTYTLPFSQVFTIQGFYVSQQQQKKLPPQFGHFAKQWRRSVT